LDGRLIADIEAAEGVEAVLDGSSIEFRMQELDGSEFTATIQEDIVTIDPVPQHRVIDNDGSPVGYLELESFISTANDQLETAFRDFINAGVQDVIIDLRYNGGGLVSTAELLGDLLGGSIAQTQVFSETRFNADRSSNNTSELFELRTNSLSLSKLVVIASQSTASASELVTNSMEPTSADVVIVGDRTFGKPVGQIGLEFCDQLIRPTAFQTLNGAGEGDYFDGLAADFEVDDELDKAVGADDDPNIVAALTYLRTGAWPASQAEGPAKANLRVERAKPFAIGRTTAEVYTGAR
jgi:C-terminal processing protease CtpA/Prc